MPEMQTPRPLPLKHSPTGCIPLASHKIFYEILERGDINMLKDISKKYMMSQVST